jgi:hypothetical protein
MFVPQRLNHSQQCNIVYRSGYNHNVLPDLEQSAKVPSTVNSTKTSNVQLNIPTQIPSVPDKNVAYMNRTCWKATATNKHWGDIHQEQGDKDFKATFIFDRTAHVVSGALLMTVDFAALMLSESDYLPSNTRNAEITIVYLVAFGIAAAASLGAILMGSNHAIVMHKFGVRKPLDVAVILEEITPMLLIPYHCMLISCYSTVIGAGCGVYLLHGWEGCLAFSVPGGFLFMLVSYYSKIAQHVGGIMSEMISQRLCDSV